jgi:hypothetical protein
MKTPQSEESDHRPHTTDDKGGGDARNNCPEKLVSLRGDWPKEDDSGRAQAAITIADELMGYQNAED